MLEARQLLGNIAIAKLHLSVWKYYNCRIAILYCNYKLNCWLSEEKLTKLNSLGTPVSRMAGQE